MVDFKCVYYIQVVVDGIECYVKEVMYWVDQGEYVICSIVKIKS